MTTERFAVELTRGAEEDLEAIHDYVSEDRSGEEADSLIAALLEKIDTLERFPSRGSVPKELEELGMGEFRQLSLPPYRLVYRVVGKKVFIVLLADGRRDMQALLERRLLAR